MRMAPVDRVRWWPANAGKHTIIRILMRGGLQMHGSSLEFRERMLTLSLKREAERKDAPVSLFRTPAPITTAAFLSSNANH